MDLSGIISISGRPGLFKVIAQGKSNIIVESLIDKKRIPAYSSDKISALDDISIYTIDGDKPIKEIFGDIYLKQDGKEGPSHKSDLSELQGYLLEILPDYDEERVYSSDIKKLFQWYNMLLKYGVLKPEEVKEEKPKAKAKPKTETEKKIPSKKKITSKAAPKKEPVKKKASTPK